MNNFWNLVGFEYKKIFMKKSVWFAIILSVITVVWSCFGLVLGQEYIDGKPVRSGYEGMLMDREFGRALSGRAIDGKLIMEASKAYQMLPTNEPRYSITKEYQKYARPYSDIYGFVRTIYNKTIVSSFGHVELQNITEEQAASLYDIRKEKIKETTLSYELNERSKEKINTLDKKVKKPIIYEYMAGYDRYFSLLYTSGLIAAFLIAICIAPIFAGEYKGADQLILSSKNGKKSLIQAKIFAGATIAVFFTILLCLITYFACMFIYGFDGANGALQLKVPLSTLPLKVGEVAILFSICVLFACIFFSVITMLFSAKLRSSFGVIIVMSLILIVPMFVSVPVYFVTIYRMSMLLPSNMMEFWNIISPMFYEIFGLSIEPYIFMPIFAALTSIIILPFAYKAFKNHQVG